MNARIKLIEGVAWMAESDSGHALVVDGSPGIGGRNLGFRPMELVLVGLGSCSAMDVLSILRKQRQQVSDVRVELSGERADAVPAVFTAINVHYEVEGSDLNEKAVQRAVDLSMEKYCSVSHMLRATVRITHSFQIV